MHVNAKQKQSFRNTSSPKLFFGSFSPSLRFRAQLFAGFVAFNINIGSSSVSSSLINTGLFSPWFSSILQFPWSSLPLRIHHIFQLRVLGKSCWNSEPPNW
jgi:hypothetical protein